VELHAGYITLQIIKAINGKCHKALVLEGKTTKTVMSSFRCSVQFEVVVFSDTENAS
jgi:hypothetical protein